ncbi:hypothetical protein PsYK624_001060 [Phanerochaete sordida]|uniref:Uncharacterized protein n=1 Tax=Phanerochaete sordida TaxID=48140 RepID=A0A9P3FWT4_9APHY|nr:hypothetical protein PsYK624_001060 [Phanerochaete sordida]
MRPYCTTCIGAEPQSSSGTGAPRRASRTCSASCTGYFQEPLQDGDEAWVRARLGPDVFRGVRPDQASWRVHALGKQTRWGGM